MKIKLEGVMETLLIPLAAKVKETKSANPRICDRDAVAIAEKIDYDFSKFNKTMSQQGVIARTLILDKETQQFIDENPKGIVISIGCGLDTRYQRLKHKNITWYNLDFPEVIRLRKQVIYEGKNVKYIAKSALNPTWTDEVLEENISTLIILEGILMYLSETDIIQLFCMIKNKFPNSIILAEIMHPMIAKQSKHHDTVKQTTAVFQWGIKDGKDMQQLCNGIEFIHEWNLMDELVDQGGLFYLAAKVKFIGNKMNKIVKLRVK